MIIGGLDCVEMLLAVTHTLGERQALERVPVDDRLENRLHLDGHTVTGGCNLPNKTCLTVAYGRNCGITVRIDSCHGSDPGSIRGSFVIFFCA